jgi:hypothetical protein
MRVQELKQRQGAIWVVQPREYLLILGTRR